MRERDLRLLLSQLAEALEALHHAGARHRDLKPTNILLRSEEPLDVLLCDFGSSAIAAETLLTGLHAWRNLLRGLLEPDYSRRWDAGKIRRWLAGTTMIGDVSASRKPGQPVILLLLTAGIIFVCLSFAPWRSSLSQSAGNDGRPERKIRQILPLLQSYAIFFTSTQGSATVHPVLNSHTPSACSR